MGYVFQTFYHCGPCPPFLISWSVTRELTLFFLKGGGDCSCTELNQISTSLLSATLLLLMGLEVTFVFSQLLLAPSGIFDDENLSLFFIRASTNMCSLYSVGGPLIIWAYAQDVLFIFVFIKCP